MNYTNELNRLFETEEAVRHAEFQWNQLDDESKKNDLVRVFDDSDENRLLGGYDFGDRLVLSNLLSNGSISPQSLLLIPDLAIKVALSDQDEVASWMRRAFCRKDVYKKLERSYIVKQIISVIDNLRGEASIDACHEGWLMLYHMGYKKELLEFMARFEKQLEGEIDENDRQDIIDMLDEDEIPSVR